RSPRSTLFPYTTLFRSQHSIDAVKIFAEMVIGNLEQFTFRIVEQIEYVGAVFIRIADNLSADADQFALNKFLQYDPAVCINVSGDRKSTRLNSSQVKSR